MGVSKRRRVFKLAVAAVLLVLAILLGLAVYAQTTSKKTDPISTSIAVPKPSPAREVKDIFTNDDGDLIITYTDGAVQNAGRVVGEQGKAGQSPTQAQISAALIEYCASGRCDSKAPTQGQILEAITAYCTGGVCRGRDGQDATPITAEQILAAVTTYCSDGRCRGVDGQSIKGDPGESTVMNCVVRDTNAATARYVAWKYVNEPDTAYRDLYKLPVWAECTSPVDLTET